jgi:hypothetical protein
VFIILAIINLKIKKKFKELAVERRKRDDDRLNCTTECLNNMKTLKFYSLTSAFEEEIIKRKKLHLAVRGKFG